MSRSYLGYFLLFAIGLLIFFTTAFTFSFKEKVFQAFFGKPFSFAQEVDNTPVVSLQAGINNNYKSGVLNIESNASNITLKWNTENSPKACAGSFWSNVKNSDLWTGEKNISGGDYIIKDSLQAGIYVYSINCINESGDSFGSNIVINVGAKPKLAKPEITLFQSNSDNNQQYSPQKINQVSKGTKVNISWSNLSGQTPYGVCVASGSWPTIYKNVGNSQISESFILDKPKIYKYLVSCSNENGYNSKEISFFVKD